MNNKVRFALESGEEFCLTLVYPKDMDGNAESISILAPAAVVNHEVVTGFFRHAHHDILLIHSDPGKLLTATGNIYQCE